MTAERNPRVWPATLLTITICLLSLPAHAKYSGGMGEPNDPYQIATAEDLIALGETPGDYDKHFILTADIDLDPNLPGRKVFDKAVIAPTSWVSGGTPFTGVFDGNGHTISHMHVMVPSGMYSYVGLFGDLGKWGSEPEVKDLGLVDVAITGSGDQAVGGLVGWNYGVVTRCFSTGSLQVSSMKRVGGLVGVNSSQGNVTQCYSAAAVRGSSEVGGLVGGNDGSVTQCYSTGAVNGSRWVGGLVGSNNTAIEVPATVTACFWDTQTSGQTTSAGGTGKTTAEMQMAKTFLDAGWDFVGETANGTENIWWILEGKDYPRLWWEKYSGDTGEPNNLYRISTAADLIALGKSPEDYDKHFILTADIDLDPNLPNRKVFDRAVIAPATNDSENRFQGTPFTGVFDGNGHTISHLTMKGVGYLGLFGLLERGAEIKNLRVVDVSITGSGAYVGGLVGYNGYQATVTRCSSAGLVSGDRYAGGLAGSSSGVLTECHSTGVVIAFGSGIGGLVGSNGGTVTACGSDAYVSGGDNVGGLVGLNSSGSGGIISTGYSTGIVIGRRAVGGLVGENGVENAVTQCYSTGAAGGVRDVGGLVGFNDGEVSQCYSTGAVNGGSYIGGLVGSNRRTVYKCYSTGPVRGRRDVGHLVGGLVGHSDWRWATVLHGVWDMETSGQSGSASGVGLTTAEMTDPYMLGLNGFANDPNWVLDPARGYPRLAWEGTVGQTIPEPDIEWLDGFGGAEHPYRIDTADQLIMLSRASALWDKHFVLGKDIHLDPNLPGRDVLHQAAIQVLGGVFDGRGNTITGLTVKGRGYLGLFGQLESRAEVRNLGVVDVNITGSGDSVGGLVGSNEGHVMQCYTTGTVGARDRVGALVGVNDFGGSISMSYGAAEIHGNTHAGGLIGYNTSNYTADCYSTGDVTANTSVGGLIGYNSSWCDVTRCYSTGAVIGTEEVGGLVGSGETNGVAACFWDIETSGQVTSAGGTGKTTDEMKTWSTFTRAGWDFETIWWMPEIGYPRLWWELSDGNRW